MSEDDSFRFLLIFSGIFKTIFVEPGAAHPVHAIIELCTRILLVFECFDSLIIQASDLVLGQDLS